MLHSNDDITRSKASSSQLSQPQAGDQLLAWANGLHGTIEVAQGPGIEIGSMQTSPVLTTVPFEISERVP